MPTAPASTCLECGAELPAGTAPGQCPNCLLGLGLAAAAGEDGGRRTEDSRSKSEINRQPDAHDPPLVTQFGDYELLEEIGHGGMGVVYRARQKSLNRVVAVKLLLFGPHAPAESVKRFRAEAVATAALQHPNIVAIHEVGVCEGQHFLVMDFVEGRSLAKVISDFKFRISDFRRAAGYLKTIAEAIHYAHEHGLLHRDLKPSNVLIDANDQPRVTDFGLAKRLEGDSELTVSGQVLGSPNYMPPEQATGKRGTASRRSDVYALGAILYHALTGRPPFVGEGLAETVQQVLNVEPVSPRALNPRLPADLETVCLKCLEKEPGKRYATARLLAEELGRFLEGKTVLARPVGPAGKAWRWCRRNPRLAWAMGAALLSLLIGMAGVTWQWRRAERIAHAEARQRARAEEQTALAETEALRARRHAYAADMKEVQRALDDNDLGRARELLDQQRPVGKSEIRNQKSEIDLRGWEWRYLWARCRSEERFPLWRYSNSVSAVAFSADGHWLAVRQEGGAVALWDPRTKRLRSELPAIARDWRWCNKALAFSPRGNRLAWGNTDSSGAPILSLQELSEQKEIARLPHSADVVSVTFAPDAQVLATLDYDGMVRVWDVESQQVMTNFPTAPVNVWAKRFIAGTVTANAEIESPGGLGETNLPPVSTRSARSRAYTDHYGCVLFSPNGRWLAVGEAAPRIRLLNQITGELREIRVPTTADGITTLAFSPDSQRLAAGFGAGDNAVHVWELGTATEKPLAGHSGWIVGLAFSPDGQTLASASTDQTLRLWDVARQDERRRFQGNTDEVWALAWSPDGNHLVTGAKDGSVRFWDPTAKASAPYAVVPEDVWFWGPAFLPDSKTFLTVTRREGEVVRWDAATAQAVERLSFLGTNHLSLDLSSDGRWLALGDKVGNVQVWDFKERRLVTNLVLQGTLVGAVGFSPHGSMLGCGVQNSDGRIVPRFWSVADWRQISLRGIDLTKFHEPAFAADEKTLAIGHTDGTAAWWNLQTGQRRGPEFGCASARAVNVAFSLDEQWFAVGGIDGRMLLWDVATRQPRSIGRGHRNELHDVAFSPDGQRLIASGTNPKGVVRLWDVETVRDLATLPGVPGWYAHIGFSPDGNTLFAAGLGGTALLWRAPSLAEIGAAENKQKGP
jgi:WD40 repeat protein/serine/threonine protein kinase